MNKLIKVVLLITAITAFVFVSGCSTTIEQPTPVHTTEIQTVPYKVVNTAPARTTVVQTTSSTY